MGLKKYIPNALTMGNLLSGCIAMLFAVHDQMEYVAIFVALGIFFDFFDGFFARLLKVQSEVGLQLDSLADMVTSGVVPGVVMYQLLLDATDIPWGASLDAYHFNIAYIGFIITLASAYRLAKFNVDDRQTNSFIGLPTPANTLFIISIPLILIYGEYAFAKAVFTNPYVLIGIAITSCYMLNAEIHLFALKFKTWSFGENKVRYLFILASILLLIFLKYLAIPLLIVLYVLLSLMFPDKNIKYSTKNE
ncbi:CDP-alcohol phosphatidyltransferase family protein [uncultured Dokdonia sp.]|uniref:CDP-alcohol phosphatidyltransferase family protein n=1 Tax=uncultured Dokdonia sp. TaxID=575653 RepID=UPI002634B89B|nr:CDP-alcohol phosphatidyltransferase family protein [uncultured Dokdonia sp.]